MTAEQILTAVRQARRLRFVLSQLGWGFPGFTRAPLGALFLLFALPTFLAPSAISPVASLLIILGGGLAVVPVQQLLLRHYVRRFGRIRPSYEISRTTWLALALTLAGGLGYGGFLQLFHLRFFPFPVAVALFFLFSWLNSEGIRGHRGLAAGLILAATFLPASTPLDADLRMYTVTYWTLIGDLLLGSLCDHLLLVHSFNRLPKGLHEHAVPRVG